MGDRTSSSDMRQLHPLACDKLALNSSRSCFAVEVSLVILLRSFLQFSVHLHNVYNVISYKHIAMLLLTSILSFHFQKVLSPCNCSPHGFLQSLLYFFQVSTFCINILRISHSWCIMMPCDPNLVLIGAS